MDQESWNQHLSQITTLWTLLHQAHAGPADAATTARQVLMQRYCGAVYRYLLGAVRDEDVAKDLFQEFVLRFLRGSFRGADPERGRFRDYVKTALIHLVTDYRRAQQRAPGALPANLPSPTTPVVELDNAEAEFLKSWREELVNRTWETLKQAQPIGYAVLLSHVEQPDLPSPQRAEELSAQLGKPMSANHVRVTRHRAREKFADLLLDEVVYSLGKPSEEELVEELRNLQLLKSCQAALERRSHKG